MRFQVHISGSVVFEGQMDGIPPVGSMIRVTMQSYKKGLFPGSIIQFRITSDQMPELDYTETHPVMYLDANGYTVIHEAPVPPGQER